MFTGIIECLGKVEKLHSEGSNVHFTISSSISDELKVDQSVAHNGVCLTVVEVENGRHTVTAIRETLDRSNLGGLRTGSLVNLERCMPASGRYDGHIVQGHVDQRARLEKVVEEDGSWVFHFDLATHHGGLVVEKGSICVNGISLTVASVGKRGFSVAIIPYTYEHTNLRSLHPGDEVNIEFDVLGKYVASMLSARSMA